MNVVRADRPRRRTDLVERRVGLAERDVLGDRAAEQVRLLRDHDDRAAQVFRVQLAQVDAVEQSPRPSSGRRSAPAASPASTCRLPSIRRARPSARPGCAGRTRAARRGRRCRRTRTSSKSTAPRACHRSIGCGRVGDARLLLEHARDLLQRRGGRLVRVVELRHLLHRVEEALRVQHDREQRADLERAADHAESADEQHDRRPRRCRSGSSPGSKMPNSWITRALASR